MIIAYCSPIVGYDLWIGVMANMLSNMLFDKKSSFISTRNKGSYLKWTSLIILRVQFAFNP